METEEKNVFGEILLLLSSLVYPWLSLAAPASVYNHYGIGEAGLSLGHSGERMLPWEFSIYSRKKKTKVEENN